MEKLNKNKQLIIGTFLGVILSILTIFLLTRDIKPLSAQQQTKYTVFKTENAGFKFLKQIGRMPAEYAPLFARTPDQNSPANQVATKEYVDRKTSQVEISYYEGANCLNPSQEQIIGGNGNRLLYRDSSNIERLYPIGLANSNWVSCLKVPINPAKNLVVVPDLETRRVEANWPHEHWGDCWYGGERFDPPCSWSIETPDRRSSIVVSGSYDLNRNLGNLKHKIKRILIYFYSDDGGVCDVKFIKDKNNPLGSNYLGITVAHQVKFVGTEFSSGGAGYFAYNPVQFDISDAGNTSKMGLWPRGVSDRDYADWYYVYWNLDNYRDIPNDQRPKIFLDNVNYILMQGRTLNGNGWGANVCKVVLEFSL